MRFADYNVFISLFVRNFNISAALYSHVVRDGRLPPTGGEVKDTVISALRKWLSTALLLKRVVFCSVPCVLLLHFLQVKICRSNNQDNKPSAE